MEHPLYNHELACPIFFPKFQITFILIGYSPSRQVLPYRPSESVLGYEQRTDEQWQTMLGER